MKFKLPFMFVVGVLFLSACASAPSSTESAVGADDAGSYPLSTRTGIEEVDVVLAAVESGDPQALRDLIGFVKTNCTTAEGLGGPPKCLANESEGTEVEVLPFLGSEGSFLRREDAANWTGLDVSRLYAVYRVSESVYSDRNYPAGEYAVVLLAEGNAPGTVLQITDGKIVRVDAVFDTSPEVLKEKIQQTASEVILAPK